MQLIRNTLALKEVLDAQRQAGKRIGLVPTMGALHEGHLSLVRSLSETCDFVVVSIFVNPTQFNKAEDLDKYPRQLEADLVLLRQEPCALVFAPQVEDMYPEGLKVKAYDLGALDSLMEGAHRPGHFNGVATVVSRLFEVVEPHEAIFGEKDFQQVAVIKRMVELDDWDILIRVAATQRAEGGLALSSRNQRLSPEQLEVSNALYQSMSWAKNKVSELEPRALESEVANRINAVPNLKVEYVSVCNRDSLEPVQDWNAVDHAQICLAVYCGEVRLIDNLSLF